MEVWPSFCSVCGQRIDREDKFCRRCGTAIPQQPFQSAITTAKPVLPPEPPTAPEEVPVVAPPPQPEPNRFRYDEPPIGQADPAFEPRPAEPVSASSWLNAEPAATTAQADAITYPARRKSRLPILEILIVALLVIGAVVAVWLTRSSLPHKSAAPVSAVEVTVTPESAQVVAGKACDLSATVSGTDDVEVDWSVEEGEDGGRVINRGAKAGVGEVSLQAVYVAPKTPGTYHVVATSKADPQKSATAEITVTAARKR